MATYEEIFGDPDGEWHRQYATARGMILATGDRALRELDEASHREIVYAALDILGVAVDGLTSIPVELRTVARVVFGLLRSKL